MVNKYLCKKISRVWVEPKGESPNANCFTEPRCGLKYGLTWYLWYRLFISLSWISIIICSLFELGSYKPLGNNYKWPIYLTNWDLLLGFGQSLIGLYLVVKRWRREKTANIFDSCNNNNLINGKLEKFYWFLYSVTSTLAIGVTVSYWVAVHDPKIHNVDPLNIMLHVCNSLLMIIDLCVTNIPIRLRCFWWCLIVITIYLIFTIIYYTAGGLDKHGYHYIYKVLDWSKPGVTFLVSLGGILFLITVHCLLAYLSTILDRLFNSNNINKGTKYIKDSPPSSNQHSSTSKDVEIV